MEKLLLMFGQNFFWMKLTGEFSRTRVGQSILLAKILYDVILLVDILQSHVLNDFRCVLLRNVTYSRTNSKASDCMSSFNLFTNGPLHCIMSKNQSLFSMFLEGEQLRRKQDDKENIWKTT
jgi:hypothetical protein